MSFYASYPVTGSGGGVPTYTNLAAFPSAVGAGNGALAVALDTDILYVSTGAAWEPLADPTISPLAITALTGDGTASGPGSAALTLKTVNSNVGSFGLAASVPTVTVNGKGLITAAANTSIQITESQVTSLVADLAAKVPTSRLINTSAPLTGGGALSSDLTIAVTSGNLTDAGTDGITVTGGTSAVLGPGTSIAQHVADTTHNGYLSSADWNTFNGKQSATLTSAHLLVGNVSNVATDVAASGDLGLANTGAFTLNTVNANVGSFGTVANVGSFTVNAKGLVTAASNTAIQIAESQVTNLVTDLSAKQSTTLTSAHLLVGNGSNVATDVAASGDLTLANTGAFTLGTVNANVGTFGDASNVGQFTVNAKGLITAASNVPFTAAVTYNVRASEGAGTTTLTNADIHYQRFDLSAGHTVKLPTTGVLKGDVWQMINPNAFQLIIQASDASNIVKSWGSQYTIVALINTPVANTDWAIVDAQILYGRTPTSFSPAITNGGTITGVSFSWLRTGITTMSIQGRFILGTPGVATQSELPLPLSLNLDTTFLTDMESDFGDWHQKSSAGSVNIFNTNYTGCLIYDSASGTQKLVFAANTSSNTFTQDSPTTIFGANFRVNVTLYDIPISEWAEV